MENKRKKAELLAPCGNWDCVTAAVNAGADAVYLGGQLFNARAYASNFDTETLEKVCDLCHCFGMKVYITVNTLYKDTEFPELLDFIGRLYTIGADGLIMQDLGAIRLVRKNWPDLPVHASTQLTVNSPADVRELEALGLHTAVLSRELDLGEIRTIAESTPLRVETFIHGALCVSYSGQCLMSSVLGNRSGNRGKCAQNCRLNYQLVSGGRTPAEGHLLSTKDICTLELLPELLDAGAASLKIEGRMKTPEYVAGVTGIYRKYLDLYYSGSPYAVDPEDIRVLQQLFNRGNFSSGYLKTHSGAAMMCSVHPRAWGVRAGRVLSCDPKKHLAVIRFEREMVPGDGIEIRTGQEEGIGCYVEQAAGPGKDLTLRIDGPVRKNQEVWQTHDKRLMDGLKGMYGGILRKAPVSVSVSLHKDQPSELTMEADGVKVSVSGEIPSEAKNRPLTRETVISQVSKMGNTIFRPESIEADPDDGLFLNLSVLNSLKNRAAESLRERLIASRKRSPLPFGMEEIPEYPAPGKKILSVAVRNPEQFAAAAAQPAVSVIYSDMNEVLIGGLGEAVDAAHRQGKKVFIRLPRIWRESIRRNSEGMLRKCMESPIDGWLISNLGHYHTVKGSGKDLALDFTGNVLNSHTAAFWKEMGVETIGVSVEMSRDEINAMPDRSSLELLAYGHLPLMVTHQCPIGNFAGGKQDRIHCERYGHTEDWYLVSGRDRFFLDTDCRNCVCTVTAFEPLDIREDVNSFSVGSVRLDFTREDPETVGRLIREYGRILTSGKTSASRSLNIYGMTVL